MNLPLHLPHYISPCGNIILINCHYDEVLNVAPDGYFNMGICDPPYGNDTDAINRAIGGKHAAQRKEYVEFENDLPPDQKYFDAINRACDKWIMWGGNYFGLKGGVIAWNKHGEVFGEGEVAICNTHASVRFFDFAWNGMIQGDMKNKEARIHSCQKPVQLYTYCILKYCKENFKIFDSHGGSCSIAVAVDKCNKMDGLNLTLVVCEKSQVIYNKAVDRLKIELNKEYVAITEKAQNTFQQSSLTLE